MNIIQTFLDLTNKTYPHGTEHLLEDQLPSDIQQDIYGNYFYQIGDEPRVIFASHLDTVSGTYVDVTHTFTDDGRIVGTDGTTTLGADDKAGVTVMLYMIENKIPGLYYFFVGEEVGCIGSGKVSRNTDIFNKKNYDKIISFDRRGNTSVITHQSTLRTCSEEFGEALCDEFNENGLGMETDDTGVCTDSLEFIEEIPECTNISVGYQDEHTGEETQDLEFLEKLCKACVEVDWEGLPTKRNPAITEYKRKVTHHRHYGNWNTSWNRSRNRSSFTPHGCNNAFNGGDLDFESDYERMEREKERHSLVCGYYEEEDDDNFPGGDDPWAEYFGRNSKKSTIINRNSDYDEEDDNAMCSISNSVMYDHRNKFFDNLNSPLDDSYERERYFESLKDKYMDDRLTDYEIQIVKDQLLDMDDPIDKAFCEDIDALIHIKSIGNGY